MVVSRQQTLHTTSSYHHHHLDFNIPHSTLPSSINILQLSLLHHFHTIPGTTFSSHRMSASRLLSSQSTSHFRKLLVVVKQTAYEEYSQLRLRGKAPKALRWKRLENRYKAHRSCVNNLQGILRHHNIDFQAVNRVDLDRQHLANVDLVLAVGGDGTVLSSAHFLVRAFHF